MADAGAHKIKQLIDTPSKRLGKLMNTLSSQLGHANQTDGSVPASTYKTISDLRRFYRHLSNQVKAVQTSSPHKREVLAALARMDTGLSYFSAGLKAGSTSDQPIQLGNARRRTIRASKDLLRAKNKLP